MNNAPRAQEPHGSAAFLQDSRHTTSDAGQGIQRATHTPTRRSALQAQSRDDSQLKGDQLLLGSHHLGDVPANGGLRLT